MSIHIGGPGSVRPLPTDGGEPAVPGAAVGGPRLGTPDLSIVSDPKLRQLVDGGELHIAGPKGEPNVPPGLNAKLDDMAGITDIFSVMALFQKMSQAARNSARTERQAELQSRVDALGEAAQKMRDAALLRLAAGVVSGLAQVAGGLFQMAGGLAGLRSPGQAQALTQVFDGLSKLTQGGGSVAQSGMEFAAANTDAAKTEAETRATLAASKYEQANDVMQQMRDVIRDVQGKLAEIEQSAHDTRKQITRA